MFQQAHNVNRNERAEILGSGFHGCTIWFTGTPLYFLSKQILRAAMGEILAFLV